MAFADLIKSNNSSILGAFLYDANRFLLKNRDILNLAPLQLYSSAIVFAPATSIIRNRFKEHIPSWLHRPPKVQQAWNAALQTLEGHSGSVQSIAFSPDGKLLASGSDDKTIKLWDTATGDVQTLEGHSGSIQSIAFSPDGKLLASGSGDETIKLWNIATGNLQQSIDVDGIIRKLWFHTGKPYLVTNIGLIRIQQSQTDVLPPQSHQSSQVFLKDSWIIWNEENIIWLPPEYRPRSSDYRDKVLALCCVSGLVTFFEIDFPRS